MRFHKLILHFFGPVACSFAAGVRRLPSEPAKETLAAHDNGRNAKVVLPAATPYPRPQLGIMELLHRDTGDNTCGYIDGDSNQPVTCADVGYICTNSGTIRDCCKSTRCATETFDSVCLDAVNCPATPGTGTYCCTYTQTRPLCVTYLWSSDAADVKTFFNCGKSSALHLLPATPTDVADTTTPTPTSDPITSSTTPPATSTPAPSPSGGSDPPVGAIVGGVVGGVAVIGLIALAFLFILKRKKGDPPSLQSPAPAPYPGPKMGGATSPMQQQPYFAPQPQPQPQSPTTMPGNPPPSYNPHYSYVGTGAPVSMSAASGYSSPMGPPAAQNLPFGEGTYDSVAGESDVAQSAPTKHDGSKGHNAFEAPAVNAVGTGNNQAELE